MIWKKMKRWTSIVFMLIVYSEEIFGGLLSFQEKENIINALSYPPKQNELYRDLYKKNKDELCKKAVRIDPELKVYFDKKLFYHTRSDNHGFILSIDTKTKMEFYHMMECQEMEYGMPIKTMNFIAVPAEYGESKEANFYRINPSGVHDGHIAYALDHYIEISKMKETYERNLHAIKEWYSHNTGIQRHITNICKQRNLDGYNNVILGMMENHEEMILALDDVTWISLPGILACTVTKSDKKNRKSIYFYLEDPINDSWIRIYKRDVRRPNDYVLDPSYADSV